MADDSIEKVVPSAALTEEQVKEQLGVLNAKTHRKYARFFLAALSSIPWVGGLLSATASLNSEKEQGRVNALHEQWIEEHRRRLDELAKALAGIAERLEQVGETVTARVESEEYMALVRQGFRVWDNADTATKRQLVQRILANAGGTTITTDDVVRLFIDWVEKYHEVHFAVIREVFLHPGATRSDIWAAIRGVQPRDDSPDADLFRLLVSDLSTGRVIRQHRETTYDGQFKKKAAPKTKGPSSGLMKSAFDDEEQYELTELGKQFVHYAMNEVVRRVGA
jgi:hypothetical protein